MPDVKTRVRVSGSAEYKTAMQSMRQTTRELDSEMKALTSSFTSNSTEAEKNQAKQELLQRQLDNQQNIVETLRNRYDSMTSELDKLADAVSKATDEYGADSVEASKARMEYERFSTQTSKVKTELNNAEAALNNTRGALENVGKETKDATEKTSVFGDVLKANLTADFAKAAITGLANAVKQLGAALKDCALDAANFADDIITLHYTTGLSTDQLQEYRYMTELVDVSLETITGSQTKLIKNMDSAREGTGAAAEAFEALGLSITDADGNLREVNDAFSEAIDALGNIDNETERDATAMALFGKSARDLNPIIALGSEGLADFAQEAHDVGYVLNGEQLSTLGSASDAYQRFNKQVEAVKNQLGLALAPALTEVGEMLSEWAQNADWEAIGEQITNVAEAIASFASFVIEHADLIIAIIAGVTAGMTALSVAMGVASIAALGIEAPILAIVAAIAAVVAAVALVITHFDQFKKAATEVVTDVLAWWEKLKENFKNGIENVKELFTKNIDEGKEMISNFVTTITDFFTGLKSKALSWGKDMIQGFVDGIKAMAGAVKDAASGIASKVSDYLHFSRPETGPLRDYEEWMPDMMRGLAHGIRENAYLVREAAADAAGSIATGINLNSAQVNGQSVGALDSYNGIMSAINASSAQELSVNVILEGDARGLFRAVRTESNRTANATGYTHLGRA